MKGVTSSKGDGAVELWELAFEMTLRLELNLELLIHHFQQIVAEHGKGQLRVRVQVSKRLVNAVCVSGSCSA